MILFIFVVTNLQKYQKNLPSNGPARVGMVANMQANVVIEILMQME